MTKSDKELSIEQEVTRDCPILFQMRYRPMNETTMCWGFECGEGWHRAIASACREFETLNRIFYPKYRVRIQADQIKEKFGTLRFYYSIVTDPNPFVTWLASKFESAYDYFNNWKKFDYKCKKVVDIEPFDYDDVREISKEDFDKKSNDKYKCTNVEYIEENGKYQEIVHLRNYGKSHDVPTKHKLSWKIKNASQRICWWLRSFKRKDNAVVRNCIEFLDRRTSSTVRALEEECEKMCEDCGHQIGSDWSPSCQTTGWITFLCEDCAKKQEGTYIKNNELWQKGKMLKTKEELSKEYTNIRHVEV